MRSLRSSLQGPLFFIMLSCLLSRSLCQVVVEVNHRSYPTFGPAFRAFTTSSPQREEASDNDHAVDIFCPPLELSGSVQFPPPEAKSHISTWHKQTSVLWMIIYILYQGSVVTYSQLKSMLSNHDVQLFDVRNPDEYQAGRISSAVNIPLGNLEESLKLSPEHFQQKFNVTAPGKDDDNIVFHCRSGNRSAKALDIARHLGFNRVRHYKGGYSEWEERERQ